MFWVNLAALSSALPGTHPVQVQSPPRRSFSARATVRSNFREERTAIKPVEPPPMISRS